MSSQPQQQKNRVNRAQPAIPDGMIEATLAEVSKDIKDPVLIQQVADRVYALFREEARHERERRG